MNTFLKASANPQLDIQKISYEGQPDNRKQYKEGYEGYLNQMPELSDDDEFLDEKVRTSQNVMIKLGNELRCQSWIEETMPDKGEFNRTILALESPVITKRGKLKEGKELVLAQWGDGFASPVHGHATGLLHEDIIMGKMLVNTYRMKSAKSNVVRPVRSDIVESGVFASAYTKNNPKNAFKRQTLIHNFKSIGQSASLHYLPEHTRDGRDNGFVVERFDDVFHPTTKDVIRIASHQAMYARKGDVILVRSTNVPEYGDHYIVITGHPIVKPHGLRPQEVAIAAPTNTLLDRYEPIMGLTLLKLDERATKAFHAFHNIKMVGGEVIFPQA